MTETAYSKFLNKLGSSERIRITSLLTGQITFEIAGKRHFLGPGEVLDVTSLASLRQLKQATSLQGLLRQGQVGVL